MANGTRIYWTKTSDPALVSYEIRRSATATTDQTVIDQVLPGQNYDAATQRFFYDDFSGLPENFYRVLGLTDLGVVLSDTGIFQPGAVVGAGLPTRVRVDHNYGAADALRYVARNGVGIPSARIRIYKEADYLAGRLELAVATLLTDDTGRWENPVFLPPGLNYLVHVQKEDAGYGPDTVTIIV